MWFVEFLHLTIALVISSMFDYLYRLSIAMIMLTNHSETQWLKTISIYYCSRVCRWAGQFCWCGSGLAALGWVCSRICSQLVASWGTAGLGWPHLHVPWFITWWLESGRATCHRQMSLIMRTAQACCHADGKGSKREKRHRLDGLKHMFRTGTLSLSPHSTGENKPHNLVSWREKPQSPIAKFAATNRNICHNPSPTLYLDTAITDTRSHIFWW